MTDKKGRYKIGSSFDPHSRLRQLRTGNVDIRLVGAFEIEKRYDAENFAHCHIVDHDFNRIADTEWFDVIGDRAQQESHNLDDYAIATLRMVLNDFNHRVE